MPIGVLNGQGSRKHAAEVAKALPEVGACMYHCKRLYRERLLALGAGKS